MLYTIFCFDSSEACCCVGMYRVFLTNAASVQCFTLFLTVQAKVAEVKGSCARNLHRILTSISFISEILKNLASDATMTLHAAAADAYDRCACGAKHAAKCLMANVLSSFFAPLASLVPPF